MLSWGAEERGFATAWMDLVKERNRSQRGIRLRYRRYDISSPQHDQVLDQGSADVWGQDWVVVHEQSRQLSGEFYGFFGETLGELSAIQYRGAGVRKDRRTDTWAMKEISSRKWFACSSGLR
jgi:hypothetical protein